VDIEWLQSGWYRVLERDPGVDYLTSRPEVDAGRIAATGLLGSGAVTFWIAAVDGRVKAGMSNGSAQKACRSGKTESV
jgi:hypothetical protein